MHRMSTQKRRIVYISDEQWTWLTGYAKAAGISASETIRDAIELTKTGRTTRIVEVPTEKASAFELVDTEREPTPETDRLIRTMIEIPAGRPFTEFRPVPKPGKGK